LGVDIFQENYEKTVWELDSDKGVNSTILNGVEIISKCKLNNPFFDEHCLSENYFLKVLEGLAKVGNCFYPLGNFESPVERIEEVNFALDLLFPELGDRVIEFYREFRSSGRARKLNEEFPLDA